jgi:hypothetical protein
MNLPRRRTIVAITAAGVVVTVLVGVGSYGLIRPARHTSTAPVASSRSVAGTVPKVGVELSGLVHTDDPVVYADSVARALFVWDTRSGLMPEDYRSVVSEDADPTGIETSGLVNDLTTYYPTDIQWQHLGSYQTAETLNIRHTYIPTGWGRAVASDPSAVRPGTTAVTIDAVRHRTGGWYGAPATTSDPVSFTIFVACRPTFLRCHILRLSGLNTPLK